MNINTHGNMTGHGNEELFYAIKDNQQLSDYDDSFVRCDMCGAAILSGKYYSIDSVCVCEDCIEACEYRV